MKFLKGSIIYQLVIALFFVFIFIFINGYSRIKEEMFLQLRTNRQITATNIENIISLWLSERVISIENATKYIEKNDIYSNEQEVENFIANFLEENRYFDTAQIVLPDLYLYVNNKKIHDYRTGKPSFEEIKKVDPVETSWYKETKDTLKITMGFIQSHGILCEKTMNICTPVKSNADKKFQGVFCGILKFSSLFDKIVSLDVPKNLEAFLVDENGKVLMELEDTNLKNKIEADFNRLKQSVRVHYGNKAVYLTKIEKFNWYIGTAVNLEEALKKTNSKIILHFASVFGIFIVFFIFAGLVHKFLTKKLESKNQEFERLLVHRSKMSEIGGLISGINHQIVFPLNTISLIITNTLDLLKKNEIDKETMEQNLELCVESVEHLNSTIDSFKNFYKMDESVSEFTLSKCVNTVLHISHSVLAKHHIEIKFIQEKEIVLHQIENFIQQILLVLIQNAKNALIEQADLRLKVIEVRAYERDDMVQIDVVDNGMGVLEKNANSIFMEAKVSKTSSGFGLGLHLSKKIAQERLEGDLVLSHLKNPTIFFLIIKKDINV